MKSEILVLPEPTLLFGDARVTTDPHAGLSLFGPFDKMSPNRPLTIAYGVIGTASGISAFYDFIAKLSGPLFDARLHGGGSNVEVGRLWPAFPGFKAAFGCELPSVTRFAYSIANAEIADVVNDLDQHKRVYKLVNLYLDKIRLISERDENIKVIVCVEPDVVWQNCRPKSVIKANATGEKISSREVAKRRQIGDLFEQYETDQYDYSVDFRRQLKARSMEHKIPIQIIRESTFRDPEGPGERKLTSISDRAWNLSTALYYKAGGSPWKLAEARPGVCYIGLTFRCPEDIRHNARTACCAAQMFLDTGDGIVFRGEFGPWYSPDNKEFHLTHDAARHLLKGVIETYREQGGRDLTEIFLHSRSEFDDEELRGYQAACPEGVRLVAVRVSQRNRGIRLFRDGDWCVRRGTLWVMNWRTAYLWASGFKTDLLTYDGWEVPSPIEIKIQHGNADIKQVSQDILGLTKLNYNACKVGDAMPVTVGFSDKVGEILISNPTIKYRRPNFRFYI